MLQQYDKWDLRFLGLAKHISQWSKDPSTKVGAVIVRPDKSVCSIGFNGFPKGMPDDDSLYANRDEKYSRIIHAEVNAVSFSNEPIVNYTLYTYPFMPCDRCFVQMAQSGIKRFVTLQATPDQLTRWGAAFDRVKKYAIEMNLIIVEIPNYENLDVQ